MISASSCDHVPKLWFQPIFKDQIKGATNLVCGVDFLFRSVKNKLKRMPANAMYLLNPSVAVPYYGQMNVNKLSKVAK
jgi:hypothetical protein